MHVYEGDNQFLFNVACWEGQVGGGGEEEESRAGSPFLQKFCTGELTTCTCGTLYWGLGYMCMQVPWSLY